ncbi:MAG: glycerol kinase GlpK [Bdellovibrionales bacterium]|nr:glycerol kinase GlpK [Bdellovibrionales bacterium]
MPKSVRGAQYILALDQGTTSSRAILYTLEGQAVASAQVPLSVAFPEDGWVEQQPTDIFDTQLEAMRQATRNIAPGDIRAIGITNQRETVVAWDRTTGKPLGPAIVWQCRRSAAGCEELKQRGLAEEISRRTGLVIDAYFSATKIAWLRDQLSAVADRVQDGSAVFGTVDSWLLYCLTKSGGVPKLATEPSNACRTMLYNIDTNDWDPFLLSLFSLPREALAPVQPSAGFFGSTSILGAPIPITGMLGDQQASLLGHGNVESGEVKCTFGTGAFLLLNTGSNRVDSSTGLLSSVAWQFAGKCSYALEGSIFIAGALIQWLRDKLGIIASAEESEIRASRVATAGGAVLVPAFVGLGAPYWNPQARGVIAGLSRDVGADHLARAALEAVAHQTADLLDAEEFRSITSLSIDGGMAANRLFCRILADLTGRTVVVPSSTELTALGAARAAAVGLGLFPNAAAVVEGFGGQARENETPYQPMMTPEIRREARDRWRRAVGQALAGC